MSDDRCWEVVGAINGNCVYVKQGVTQREAHEFIKNVKDRDGTYLYCWPDDEAIRVMGGPCAFWARRMRA